MICSGNTCRSPMAMALLADHLAQRGVATRVHSAGTLGWGGPATANSVAVMAERGLDLTHHESQRLNPGLVVGADLLLGMTRNHVSGVLAHDPTAVDRTFVIGEAVRLGTRAGPMRADQPLRVWTDSIAALRPNGRTSGRLPDEVEDPVGEPIDVYRRTADQLDGFTAALAELLAPALARHLAG
jgi:protein-tyrosine phosphatase